MRYKANGIYDDEDVEVEEKYYESIAKIIQDHGFKLNTEIYSLNYEDVAMELAKYCIDHELNPENTIHSIEKIIGQMDDGELTCEYESGMRYIFDQEFEDADKYS